MQADAVRHGYEINNKKACESVWVFRGYARGLITVFFVSRVGLRGDFREKMENVAKFLEDKKIQGIAVESSKIVHVFYEKKISISFFQ